MGLLIELAVGPIISILIDRIAQVVQAGRIIIWES